MNQRDRILSPYTRRVDDVQHRILKVVGVTSLIGLAMVLGFFLGVFGLQGWFIGAVPLVALGGIALWMAPDLDTTLDGTIIRLFFLYFVLLIVWPNYIAFNAPGLPWISFQRVALFLLALTMIYNLSTSARLRNNLVEILGAHKWLIRFFVAWVVIETLMLPVGKFEFTERWVSHQLTWTFMFIAAAYVATFDRIPQILLRAVLLCVVVTSAVVIPEYQNGKPIWADHLPSFLSIEPRVLESLQFGAARLGEYRSRSIFTNSLVYAEYLGLLIPFTLLAMSWARKWWNAALAFALMCLMITAGTLTQARTAMVVIVATIPAFAAMYALRRYKLESGKGGLLPPTLIFLIPSGALVAVVAALSIGRFRSKILGSGQHNASNDARERQWEMAIPKVVKNPFGYGLGSIDDQVPYYSLKGKFTIDSYPINLLIEYGVPGFVAFVGFFVTSIILGVRVYTRAEGRDEQVAGAAAIGILAFMLARLVLSTEAGQNIAFVLSGLILGIFYRQVRRIQRDKAAQA